MKYFARAIVLIGLASLTFAFDGNVSWEPPTQYTNGDPLLEQDLDYYTMYCDGQPLTTIDSIIGQRTAVVDLTPLGEGTHDCTLTVTTLNGQESAHSNVASFTVGPRVPGAPTTLVITLQ